MKVCVIGAGPSGLTTIKQLLDEGHAVTCFERQDDIGGIWHRHANDAEQMKAYDSLILTISMKLMAFSDFMPEGERIFANHKEYRRYLEAYAARYRLREHISFSSAVDDIRFQDGSWSVTVTSNGQTAQHVFDAVALCTGPFKTPNMSVTDLDKFTGEVLHSSRYRNNERFRGKRVLVVGLAESGADIVREISDMSAACTLAIRSRSFLLPRLHDGENATDMFTMRGHHYEMYVRSTKVPFPMKAFFGDSALSRSIFLTAARTYGLLDAASSAISKLLPVNGRRAAADRGTNNLGQSSHPRKLDLFTEYTKENIDAINDWNDKSHKGEGNWSMKAIFSKNVSFIPNIISGKIVVNDTGIQSIAGRTVHFNDGTVSDFDAIVLCTGFYRDFSIGDVKVKDNNVRNLYKHCIHPDYNGRLALMGFVRPFSGGIPICTEMQARYFSLLCSGKLKLPANVKQVIEEEKAWEETFTAFSPQHTESIPSQVLYLDSIAKEIGCLMPISELIFKPELLVRQWFYSFNQSCYRLTGPHNMYDSAVKQIMSEEPPGRSSSMTLMCSVLSMLPYFIHPKNLEVKYTEETERARARSPERDDEEQLELQP